MLADADIQIWLDTQFGAEQALIVPFVQSEADKRLQYHINLTQERGGSASQVSQQGNIALAAGKAAPLSRLSVSAERGGTCQLEVVLRDQGKEVARFDFDCAQPR